MVDENAIQATNDSRDDRFVVFSYLTADKAEFYRRIVQVFAEAKAGFLLHLRPAEVAARLAADGASVEGGIEAVESALSQLCHWNVLESYADTADVATLADFHRRRLQYQLTASGEAVHAATLQFLAQLDRRITLDAAALNRIHDYLAELQVLAASDPIDSEKAFAALRQLTGDVEDLTARAQSFFRWLHEQTESRRSDLEAFLAYKGRLIEYLQEFVSELLTRGAKIAGVLTALGDHVDRLLAAAVHAETRETFDAADSTGQALRDETLQRWRMRWQGLRRWFLSDSTNPAQSRQLQAAARAAIPRVLTLARQQRLRRGNKSDRAADLRELAAWFLEADDDRAAHRLWRAAFGLSAARHLPVDAARLQQEDVAGASANTSWADAPAVTIAPQLRATGRQPTASPTRNIIDTRAAKAELKRRLVRERSQEDETRGELIRLGQCRLSQVGRLSTASFGLLLELLDSATDLRRHGQSRAIGVSRDGRVRLEIEWLSRGREKVPNLPVATLRTDVGSLSMEDAVIQVTASR
jgi:uncharacterized protein (TIGR02677 family)